jgi:hypothetical protein
VKPPHLMEKMYSEFRTFGESLAIVCERVDRIEPTLNKVSEDVEVLKTIARSHSETLRVHNESLRVQTGAILAMQADLKKYNQRLELVEAKNP